MNILVEANERRIRGILFLQHLRDVRHVLVANKAPQVLLTNLDRAIEDALAYVGQEHLDAYNRLGIKIIEVDQDLYPINCFD